MNHRPGLVSAHVVCLISSPSLVGQLIQHDERATAEIDNERMWERPDAVL
jgi:hypothetical protein